MAVSYTPRNCLRHVVVCFIAYRSITYGTNKPESLHKKLDAGDIRGSPPWKILAVSCVDVSPGKPFKMC